MDLDTLEPPKAWLETCRPVPVPPEYVIPDYLKAYFDVYVIGEEQSKDPASFEAFRPLRCKFAEEPRGNTQWRLCVPNAQTWEAVPPKKVTRVRGQKRSYLLTLEGTLLPDQTELPDLTEGVVLDEDNHQHLTRFYLLSKSGEDDRFILQVMLTEQEYEYYKILHGLFLLDTVRTFSPYLELQRKHIKSLTVSHMEVLTPDQFLVPRGVRLKQDGVFVPITWYRYHPVYVSRPKNSRFRLALRSETKEWSPLAHVIVEDHNIDNTAALSFPIALQSCQKKAAKPSFDEKDYRFQEEMFVKKQRVENRKTFFKKQILKNTQVKFMFILPKNVNLNFLNLNSVMNTLTSGNGLLRAFSVNQRFKTIRLTAYEIVRLANLTLEEVQERLLSVLPNMFPPLKVLQILREFDEEEKTRYEEKQKEAKKDILKKIFFPALKSMNASIQGFFLDNEIALLTDVNDDLIERFRDVIEGVTVPDVTDEGYGMTIEVDFTRLLAADESVWIFELSPLYRIDVPFEESAKGRAERAQEMWTVSSTKVPPRSAGVSPSPNPGYWVVASKQNAETFCAGFVWI